MPDNNNRNKIEDVKRRLYDPQAANINRAREGVLHQVNHEVETEWKTEPEIDPAIAMTMKKPPTSIFKKFFIGTIIFFVGAIGFAAYMYLNGGVSVSNDNIDVKILGNAFTKGGDQLPLQVEIVNNNKASLELSDLVVEYPHGAIDDPSDVVRLPIINIGTISPGQTVTRNINVTLFGSQNSSRIVNVSLEYHPGTSNAIFTKAVQYPVTISSAPISLVINAPDTAISDQEVSFTITASLNTALPAGPTMLQVVYPNNFTFDSATPAAAINNDVWDLSGLTQTNPLSIVVKGKLVGQDGDQQVFHVYAGTTSQTDKSQVNVVYNSLLQTIAITKPFLETHILIGNQDLPSYTASGGDRVHVDITWVNNLPTLITDAQIIATLGGNAFDKTAVSSSDGFYDSQNSRIVWDKNTNQELGSIEPGATGTVGFYITPISLIGSTSISSPQVTVDVSIKGTQPSLGGALSDVNNFSQKVIKILSDFQIAASATFDPGSLPPKVGTETKYDVTWTLSNSANTITGAQARAVLPIYVDWVGPTSTNTENLSYNATTREVIWNIGAVRPNTGFTSNREASFILSLSPSLSQVGSVPQLMQSVSLSGTDSFAGVFIQSTARPITTRLNNDPNFQPGNETVIQ